MSLRPSYEHVHATSILRVGSETAVQNFCVLLREPPGKHVTKCPTVHISRHSAETEIISWRFTKTRMILVRIACCMGLNCILMTLKLFISYYSSVLASNTFMYISLVDIYHVHDYWIHVVDNFH